MNRIMLAKQADLFVQFAALLIPFTWGVIARNGAIGFCAYFSVGLVQVLSCLLNRYLLESSLKSRQRRSYEKMLLAVFITAAILFIGGYLRLSIFLFLGLLFGYAMLLTGVAMGIWYAAITAEELGTIRKTAIKD